MEKQKLKERPILFNAEMVRAVLDDRKTQMRRVMTPQPKRNQVLHDPPLWGTGITTNKGKYGVLFCDEVRKGLVLTEHYKCPYGAPGDQLWVRETFAYITDSFAVSQGARYRADGCELFFKTDENLIPDGAMVFNCLSREYPDTVKYRPSIHMPRWASRIQLEITDVRVERVQDIHAKECWAEGIPYSPDVNPRHEFIDLWNPINEKRGFGWDANPWVWVVEFKRISQ